MQHGVKRKHLSEAERKEKVAKDQESILVYRKLTSLVFNQHDRHQIDDAAFENTTTLLTLNPEFYTIWNIRREILEAWGIASEKSQATITGELMWTMVILKRFPKCYWVWNHRRWCLFALENANWDQEFKLVSTLLEADSRNFHGWGYRRFVVEQLQTNKPEDEVLKINVRDFDYTTEKISGNISNFSAWHRRSKLIPVIYQLVHELGVASDYPQFASLSVILEHDLELLLTGMYMDSTDSSVWTYLHWLLTEPLFVDELRKEGTYENVLRGQLEKVSELNSLEVEDNGKGGVWCLKTMVLIQSLLEPNDDINKWLSELITIDPMRAKRYQDQISGKSPIL